MTAYFKSPTPSLSDLVATACLTRTKFELRSRKSVRILRAQVSVWGRTGAAERLDRTDRHHARTRTLERAIRFRSSRAVCLRERRDSATAQDTIAVRRTRRPDTTTSTPADHRRAAATAVDLAAADRDRSESLDLSRGRAAVRKDIRRGPAATGTTTTEAIQWTKVFIALIR